MEKSKDLSLFGKFDYDRESAMHFQGTYKTFSVNIFKWVLKYNMKSVKPSKGVVRVVGDCHNHEAVFAKADEIVRELNSKGFVPVGFKKTVRVRFESKQQEQ